MADRTEALILRMEADISRMEKSLRKIAGETDRQLKRVEDRFYKTNQHIKRTSDDLGRGLRTSVAAIAATFAFREIAQAADKWTSLRNQVNQYTDVLGPAEQATDRLLQVANGAGVAIDSLGTTFAASARAAKTLGASSEEVFAFNEAVAKGAQIANTGTAAVNGALVQLGQAIGSPKVQLQEFNSVIEGTPRLAQAFADGVTEAGGSIAKLRELIASGEISGGELFKGLLSQLPTLRREFNVSEATIGRSLNKLNNQFLQYVGNADKATNGTKILNGFIETIANNFSLLADATVVASLAIGGTLAAQAVAKAIAGVYRLTKGLLDAKTAMEGMRNAAAIFGGPLGVVIAGVGGALVGLALSAGRAEDAFDRLQTSLEDYKRIQGDIARDTEQMRSLHEAVRSAIESQGDEAEATARREEVAIAKRIAANEKLAGTMRATIQAQLVEAERALTEKARPGNRFDQFLQLLGAPLEGVAPRPDVNSLSVYQARIAANRMLEERKPGATTEEQFRKYVDTRMSEGRPLLSEDDNYIVELLSKIDLAEAKVADLRAQVQALDNGSGGITNVFGGAVDATSAATKAAQGYQTALEQLKAALDPLRELREGEVNTLGRLERAYETNRATAEAAADDMKFIREQEAALEQERSKTAEAFALRSRVAVQAILGYASASGDLSDALKQANDAADLLTSADRVLVLRELTKLIGEATDAVASGYDKLVRDRNAKLLEIDRAMKAALGFTKEDFDAMSASVKRQLYGATSVYLDAIDAAYKEFKDGVAGLTKDGATSLDLDTPGLDRSLPSPDISNLVGDILTPDALVAFQEAMAQSIKYALRDGIVTGDWDEAFRNVLTDAVVSGMDSALTRLSDWIAEFLFAPNGFLGSVINSAGAWAGSLVFGGARAAGGPVSAGKTYLVGERGPELLTMSGNGHVINANETNKMLKGGGGGMGAPVINLHVAGSIDAVTWPKVEAALQSTSKRLVSAVPGMVDARLIYNRTQKRRL